MEETAVQRMEKALLTVNRASSLFVVLFGLT
jgi:hypothetical protein